MILTVDVGNTNIKFGAWDKDELVFISRLQTNTLKTRDEYAINLVDMLKLKAFNSSQFDGAIISSVVPPLSMALLEAVRDVIQTKRIFLVSPKLKTGMKVKLDSPDTLGSDMVCCAVSAAEKYTMPCIIIGMGTATTIFALDKDGFFLGGSLAPGVVISLEALASKTAQLPHISLDSPAGVIGTNTVDCMKSGAVYGAASMLDGMIRRIKKEIGAPDASVVASGGITPFVIPYCEEPVTFDDSLVLKGLKLIYDMNWQDF
ncbi:MAG: type III pantothenate kinase [Oscillospiraceae bacterium]|nr:type III pantothenate kinase [Oscillospiraceae bacterium]